MTAEVELTEEEKARRAEASRKRQATRLANEERKAAEERKATRAKLLEEKDRLHERLPQLRTEYHQLLERLARDKGFDRGKWNKLDHLQSSILNITARLKKIGSDLESYGSVE